MQGWATVVYAAHLCPMNNVFMYAMYVRHILFRSEHVHSLRHAQLFDSYALWGHILMYLALGSLFLACQFIACATHFLILALVKPFEKCLSQSRRVTLFSCMFHSRESYMSFALWWLKTDWANSGVCSEESIKEGTRLASLGSETVLESWTWQACLLLWYRGVDPQS